MMHNDFSINKINRVIAHKIYPKTKKKPAEAEATCELLAFDESDKGTLIKRIEEALSKTSKTFLLEFEDESKDSVYRILTNHYSFIDDNSFINTSISLADKLADSHNRVTIPGGYCIIGDGVTDNNKYFVFIIKAELQEVFNINANKLEIIKNVFLSPAKDFYKIGFFLNDGEDKYKPYMYDDQFTSQKNDLTEYFYGGFLGLTTHNNDRIQSKSFYNDTMKFIQDNISENKDRFGMEKALNVYFREDTVGIISASEFSNKYFSDDERLKKKYDKEIVERKYPRSFIKNKALIDKKLQLERISIGRDITIVNGGENIEDVHIFNNETFLDLQPILNNGMKNRIIVLSSKEQ